MRKITIILAACLIVAAVLPGAAFAQDQPAGIIGLDEALALAKQHNSQLKMAAHSLEGAEAKLKEARAQLWPSLDATLSFSETDSDPVDLTLPVFPNNPPSGQPIGYLTMPGQETPPYTTSINLSQPLFADPLRVQYEMARQTLALRQLEYSEALDEMTYNVTVAYYQVVKARLGEEIAKRSLQQAEANLRTAQAQFTAGLLAKNQVLQVELAVANARQNLLRMGNLHQLALAGLRMQLGLAQGTPLSIAAEIAPPAGPELDEPPLDQVDRRFDVQKAQVYKVLAELGVRMAKAGYSPIASLNLGYTAYGDSPTIADGTLRLTLAVRWSYSLGGKTQATVKAAQADQAKAEEALNLCREGGRLEITQAHLELQEAADRLRLTALTLDLARENLRLATKRYELGAGTPQEATDAQLSLEQAEMNELNARFDLFLSGLKLAKALGRLHE